jgi:hypothetical protein
MAQAVSRRPLTVETRIRSWVSARRICGEQNDTGTGFSPSSSVFTCQYDSTVAIHTHMSPARWLIGQMVTTVQRHGLTPSTLTTGYGLDGRGSIPSTDRNFPFAYASGSQPVSYPMDTIGSSPCVTLLGLETGHSHPCSTEISDPCSYFLPLLTLPCTLFTCSSFNDAFSVTETA